SRAHPAPVRAGRLGVHGGHRGRALGDHPRGRPLGRGDGDRHGAQARAHRESRLRGRLLRHGGSGFRPRLRGVVADGAHGGDGGGVGGASGVRRGGGEARARGGGGGDAGRVRAPARRPLRRGPRLRGRHRRARGDARHARVSPRGDGRVRRPPSRRVRAPRMIVRLRAAVAAALLATAACGAPVATPPEPAAPAAGPAPATPADHTGAVARSPILPPARALLAGLMPLHSAGVDEWRARHPAYDGRGVLIGILDTGVDPGVDGLIATSTGAPKLLDVRDFSGEGRGADGTVTVAGRPLAGAGRIARLTSAAIWYAGVLRELPLGRPPAADLNGDGTNRDEFPVVVVRAPDGWVAFLDTNLDGSFEDEMPLHDYRQGRETLALGTRPITLAANFGEADGAPTLDFVFDRDAHGTHVAGIAAGHDLFNVAGFDGVAPGAQLLGLKIANDARGGISTTGSIARALAYAARFAEQRNLPLVLNLSWGIGNEPGARAVLDSLVDAFLAAHPDVVLTVSAGND